MALILVTGATGRLGRLLCNALLSRGEQVRAVVRPDSTSPLPAGAQRYSWDLAAGPLPLDAFGGVSKAVHLAGLVGEHPYQKLVQQNAFATKNFLSNCPSTVQKVVLASSISVYGEYRGQTVDESFPAKAESPYGKSKLLAESFARESCGSLPIVFLRLGMIYGPDFTDGYFQVLDYLSRGKMQILGGGQNRIPLLHQRDALEAFLLALEKPLPSCREYNVVGAEAPTQQQLLFLASQSLGAQVPKKKMPVFLVHASVAAMSLMSSAGLAKKPRLSAENIRQLSLDRAYSAERAKGELGFEAKVKLDEGMKEVVAAYLKKRAQE